MPKADITSCHYGVIATVEQMVLIEQQPLVGYGAPLFELAPGAEIEEQINTPVLQDQHDHVEIIQDAPQGAEDITSDKNQTAQTP